MSATLVLYGIKVGKLVPSLGIKPGARFLAWIRVRVCPSCPMTIVERAALTASVTMAGLVWWLTG
ncbi:hypothetical protein [Candidatus Methylacidithermus pantelleriae]|uniref:Uncharacterized protein n=1 Tax=Candidatus Methylacidithermus pantelleriae TaxID=2744239 RepID=A0A8J2BMW0_9BACT|nr:hypothetical protein [Candidatus Methylacidithermus pantelleriae]CAF0697319.1 hypothetical protein MPNT_210045 [Candidatus Methylacidithermus pantelleriae]